MKLSLRGKFLLISGAGQVVVIGLLLWNSLRLMDDAVNKNAFRVAHEYAVTLNLSLTPYAGSGRLTELTSYLTEMLKDPRDSFARYVVVLDPNGSVLLRVGRPPKRLDVLFTGTSGRDMGGMSSILDGDVLHVSTPLLLQNNQVGGLYFGISTADLAAARELVLQQGELIALICLVLGLLICYAFSAGLGRRLTALTDQSKRLARGDFSARPPARGNDELDFFSRSLNTMSSALRARISDLDQAERRLGESEERFRVLFDTAPVSLIVTNGEGAKLASNLTFSRVFGQSDAQLRDKCSSDVDFWASPDERARIWAIFARDSAVLGETAKVKLVTGRQGEMAIWSSSVTLDDAPAVVWAFLDLTEELEAKRALYELNVTLESRVQERSAELVAANVELSQALVTLKRAQHDLIAAEKMASLGSLVAGVAHELNTPIGNCLLAATTLADRLAALEQHIADGSLRRSLLDAHIRDIQVASMLITRSLERAAGLITAFKQVAVDQTNDQRRRFDLVTVLEDIFTTYAPRLRRDNCKASVVAPESLLMDSYPGSLYQVFSNLINNALAHAFAGLAEGTIAVSVDRNVEDHVEISFSDDGVGMPESVLRRVFDPFFTTKMGQGGTGLGMNIVYNIVTGILGGTILITAHEGQGTTVKMSLPVQSPVHEGARPIEQTQ